MRFEFDHQASAHARYWDNPEAMLARIEAPRIPYQEPLAKIAGQLITAHFTEGQTLVEIGAGTGYLKELIPAGYHDRLVSTEYNVRNLRAGMGRRPLNAVAASAYTLPFRDRSVDGVVDLDAFDTLPSLDGAFEEVKRVLRPDSKYIHFQALPPDLAMLERDFPDIVWLPYARRQHHVTGASGVDRNAFLAALRTTTMPKTHVKAVSTFMANSDVRPYMEDHPNADAYIDLTDELINQLDLDRIVIPSLLDYLKEKLDRSARHAGLTVIEAGHKQASRRAYSQAELGGLVLGRRLAPQKHTGQVSSDGWSVASMMVLVAQNTPSTQDR